MGGVDAGREALARHDWAAAYELLAAADADGLLDAADLEDLAQAAYWSGRPSVWIDVAERACEAHQEAGDRPRAAGMALEAAHGHFDLRADAIGLGWLSRAEHLLDGEPECAELGQLVRIQAYVSLQLGALEEARALATRTAELGERFGNRDLQALALQDEGLILVATGDVEAGMALLDRATAAAVSGELSLLATGYIYCHMIGTCQQIEDHRRAGEWTVAALRWCQRQRVSGFPGRCRMYRARSLCLRGQWDEAEVDALAAIAELDDRPRLVADAYVELGEVRRRRGDLAAAEEAFTRASELGADPEPGLSLLRLNQGHTGAAVACIGRALDGAVGPTRRLALLPARVEIALAAGDVAAAAAAADELAGLVDLSPTPMIRAASATAAGAVALAGGDAVTADRLLREAVASWQEAEAPWDAARARVLLARACRAAGDEPGAAFELRAAASTFERLGAALDQARTADLLAPAGRRECRSFLFTDIVRSTPLLAALGDEQWAALLGWHDRTIRSAVAAAGGEVVNHTGDGFFAAFPSEAAAVGCAVAVQRTLAAHRREHGFSLPVRTGVHTAEATRVDGNYVGRGVHEAARVAGAADAGEVFVTTGGGGSYEGPRRTLALKGFEDPVEVVVVDWQGASPTTRG